VNEQRTGKQVDPAKGAKRAEKAMLERLRAERAALVEAASGKNQLRRAARRKIRAELSKGPATVPTVAASTGLATSEVLWHVAAMRKYGELVEDQKDGDYFTYRLVGETAGGAATKETGDPQDAEEAQD
jgi:predicted Rossmann fold nucleotide-binding protein DprA/Smf involved in DNA uptake